MRFFVQINVIAWIGLATLAPWQTAGQSPLSFPYLDGSEAAFPSFRQAAETAAAGYVMVTLLARADPSRQEEGGELHTGSGIVLDRAGLVLTAAHIARGRQFDIRITLRNGRRLMASVIKISPENELALLRTDPLPDAVPLAFGANGKVMRGDPALAIGSPSRRWGVASVGRVRVPRLGERLDYGGWGFDNALEIAMEVESGHSGGPVINARGELIGMIAGYELGDTTKPKYLSPRIAYAVPVDDIRKWLGR